MFWFSKHDYEVMLVSSYWLFLFWLARYRCELFDLTCRKSSELFIIACNISQLPLITII